MLVAERLTKAYGGTRVVDDVSFEVPAGSVTGFLGANGAGKTTTIRLMLDLARGEGRTTVLGRPLKAWRCPPRVVGAALGGVDGHPRHRVRDHLATVAAGAGLPRSRVGEALAGVGMADAASVRLRELSLGMAQRVGLAQALLGDPPVLVLDEPANGLDPQAMHWLRGALRRFAGEGRAVLVSSHLLAELGQVADRFVVLARGRVVAERSARELAGAATSRVTVESPHVGRLAALASARGVAVELLEPPGRARLSGVSRQEVGDLAAAHGVGLHLLVEEAPSLEDFYLSVAAEGHPVS